jgi:hypothetical protein
MAVVRAFNSLKSFERLKSSGVSEEQARIFVDIFEQVTTNSVEHLASKEDLHNTELVIRKDIEIIVASTRNELKEDITAVKQELKEDIAALKQDNAAIKAEMSTLKKVGFLVFGAIVINIIISLMHMHP